MVKTKIKNNTFGLIEVLMKKLSANPTSSQLKMQLVLR